MKKPLFLGIENPVRPTTPFNDISSVLSRGVYTLKSTNT